MDYTNLLNQLNKASLFELYRLSVAIENELNNPKHLLAVKQQLTLGMKLSYFDPVENRLIKATLVECKKNKAVVLDHDKNKRYIIPYCMLNIDGADTDIHKNKKTDELTANNLQVGERVGFNNKGEPIVGIIKRLNQKTVTMITKSGHQWRVAYTFLYRIHDGEVGGQSLPIRIIE